MSRHIWWGDWYLRGKDVRKMMIGEKSMVRFKWNWHRVLLSKSLIELVPDLRTQILPLIVFHVLTIVRERKCSEKTKYFNMFPSFFSMLNLLLLDSFYFEQVLCLAWKLALFKYAIKIFCICQFRQREKGSVKSDTYWHLETSGWKRLPSRFDQKPSDKWGKRKPTNGNRANRWRVIHSRFV